MKTLILHTKTIKNKIKYLFIINTIIYINSANISNNFNFYQIQTNNNINTYNNQYLFQKNFISENSISENSIYENQISENSSILEYNKNIQNPYTNEKKFNESINYTENKNQSITTEKLHSSISDFNYSNKNHKNKNIILDENEYNEQFKNLFNPILHNDFIDYNEDDILNPNETYILNNHKDDIINYNEEDILNEVIIKYQKIGDEILEKFKKLSNKQKDEIKKSNEEFRKNKKNKEKEIEISNKNEHETKKKINNIGRKTWKSKIQNFKPDEKTHTKNKNDNIIKKINTSVIENFRIFINEKIKKDTKPSVNEVIAKVGNVNFYIWKRTKKNKTQEHKYNRDINKKTIKYKLFKISNNLTNNSNIRYNIGLINSTMGDILSCPILRKPIYKISNKIIINTLISRFPEEYKELFNIKYLDVIKYYANTNEDEKINKLLKGMKKFKEKPNDEYTEKVKNIMKKYDTFLLLRNNTNSKNDKNNISNKKNNKKNKLIINNKKLFYNEINDNITRKNINNKKKIFLVIEKNNKTFINKKRKKFFKTTK